MKTLILYKSITGFTERYARMIAEQTGADLMKLKDANKKIMGQYDTIVYGGALYAGALNGIKKAKEMFAASGAGRLMIFGVGAMPVGCPMIADMWKNNLSEEELQKFPHWYMVGGLDYDHMKLVHKIMMKTAVKGVEIAKDRDENAETFLKTVKTSFDGVDPAYAEELIAELNQGQKENKCI